jgi:hypothetical protein
MKWEDSMLQATERHDTTPDHELSDELLKLIRKLRWVGMDDDARRLQRVVGMLPANERGSILAEPPETD